MIYKYAIYPIHRTSIIVHQFTPSVFFLFIFLFSIKTNLVSQSQPILTAYHFDKGDHFSTPRNLFSRLKKRPDTIVWQCRFDTSCCYLMLDKNGKYLEDQWDLNKLVGISFHYFNPHINTAMVGWRHNPEKHLIELVPYWHLDGKRYFRETDFVEILPNETFDVTIISDKKQKQVTTIIKTQKGIFSETKTIRKIGKRVVLINPYFGGTSPAPCIMTVFCERLDLINYSH
jgi:hypothetical protein